MGEYRMDSRWFTPEIGHHKGAHLLVTVVLRLDKHECDVGLKLIGLYAGIHVSV
jgi:hypothetical protein